VTVDECSFLAERFEAHRDHLRAVAFRMLGSVSEADDAVQEAWLRLSRSDTSAVDNLGGWLTTVVGRVCLDMLRSRTARREQPLDVAGAAGAAGTDGPEDEVVLADSVGLALLVVLDTLAPAERLAFVLHDMFAVPFDDIAGIVGRSPDAARQLASRARRRVQGADAAGDAAGDPGRAREIVDAFLAAARGGDLDGLIALLAPDAVVRADAAAAAMGAEAEVRGAAAVAKTFVGRAQVAQPALIDGRPGLVFARGGTLHVVFRFEWAGDRVAAIDLVADPEAIAALDIDRTPIAARLEDIASGNRRSCPPDRPAG
jgi:RNA polymerase sigma factor (sigma-70 family)